MKYIPGIDSIDILCNILWLSNYIEYIDDFVPWPPPLFT